MGQGMMYCKSVDTQIERIKMPFHLICDSFSLRINTRCVGVAGSERCIHRHMCHCHGDGMDMMAVVESELHCTLCNVQSCASYYSRHELTRQPGHALVHWLSVSS